MPYEGPGIYRHYKGGHYRVIGIAQHHDSGAKVVIYHSYNLEHDLPRFQEGVDFILRPLDKIDADEMGETDAFNKPVITGEHRFVKYT